MPPISNPHLIYTSVPSDSVSLDQTLSVNRSELVDVDTVALDGGFLLKIIVVAPEPFMKALMVGPGEKPKVASPPYTLGQPIYGPAVAVVLRSEDKSVKVGDHVYGFIPFKKYLVLPSLEFAWQLRVLKNEANIAWSSYLGIAGLAGMTAYMGWKEHVKAKKGETIFVSTAAGGVGSLVVQLAKLEGLRVIASSGPASKVAYTKELGADVAFNYKDEDMDEVLAREGPIDLYWDNVGGKALDLALKHAAMGARFIECGMISTHLSSEETDGIKNLFQVIPRSITIFGMNFYKLGPIHIDDFYETVPKLVGEGKLTHREVRYDGFEKLGEALRATIEGTLPGTKGVIFVEDD